MSLHEVDLANHDRLNPAVNAPDHLVVDSHGVLNRQAHATNQVTLRAENAPADARVAFENGNISVYRSDGTLLSRFGVRPSDSQGATEIAKPNLPLT